MIHVCYGLYDEDGRYSKFVGTSMTSIFENVTDDVAVHILHDNTLTDDNRDKFNYLAGHYNKKVKFYNVEVLAEDKIIFLREQLPQVSQKRFTIGAFYRLLIPELIPVDIKISRVIYLDADILVNIDLAELWNVKLGDSPLAAVPEMVSTFGFMLDNKFIVNSGLVKKEDYFNSGVLLMDLDKINSIVNLFDDGVNFLINNPQCDCFDQDVLNNFFSTSYLKLPLKFNSFVDCCKQYTTVVERNIYHFADRILSANMEDEFNRVYLEYFVKTPWFDLNTLGNIFSTIYNLHNKEQLLMIRMTKIMAGKTRMFFFEEHNGNFLKDLFDITEDEEIVYADPIPQSVEKLIISMRETANMRVAFIFVAEYDLVRNILIQNDFVEEEDFINGIWIFPDNVAVPFNSNFVIREM